MNNHLEGLENSNKIVDVVHFNSYDNKPCAASVIIITYNTKKNDLELCLDALNEQGQDNYEIIIVDNNDQIDICPTLLKYKLKYIKLKANYGVNFGRNIGTVHSNGPIIIFLDDDAIPGPVFVEKHLAAYKNSNVLALRGKVLPKNDYIYNYFASRYDLGNSVIPWMIDLEGNSSFKKDILFEVGGFDPTLWGHEGIEISYRILEKYGDKEQLIYTPNPIIYHDYSNSFKKYIKKELRHDNNHNESTLTSIPPHLVKLMEEYTEISQNLHVCSLSISVRIKIFGIRKVTSLIKKLKLLTL